MTGLSFTAPSAGRSRAPSPPSPSATANQRNGPAQVAQRAGGEGEAGGVRQRHHLRPLPQPPHLLIRRRPEERLARVEVRADRAQRVASRHEVVGPHVGRPEAPAAFHPPLALALPHGR